MLIVLGGAVVATAQTTIPPAFLLYPNYRGLIFSDREEILVQAPSGASVTVRDKVSGATVATAQSSGGRARIATGTLTQDHTYTVTVTNGGSTIGRWDVKPVPASRRSAMRVSVDPKGRLLLHGKPRFALGVYDSGGSYSTNPSHYESHLSGRLLDNIPLNLYLNYHWGNAPIGAMNALMDVLQKRGMMYLQTGNCFADGSHTRQTFAIHSDSYVTQFRQHPAAAGYYIADECTDRLIPETEANHQRLARLDPDSMTLAITLAKGYIDPRKWVEAADVTGPDPYPLYGEEPAAGYTHFQVGDYVAYSKEAVRDTRPIFSVLQFFKFTSDSRYPTAAELRAHAVMSIVEGAKGLFWWDVGVNGVRKNADSTTISTQMANLRSLVEELAKLEPVLLADDTPGALIGNSTRYGDALAGRKTQLEHNINVEWLFSNKRWYQEELDRLNAGNTSWSPMLPGAATVRTKVKVVGGKGYVFAYNYKNSSTPVTLTWYQSPGTVTENRSGRSFTVSGSSWSDTLGPYEARIYVISNGGTNPPGGSTEPAPSPSPSPSPGALSASFTNPASGATVSGTTTVSVSATGGTAPYTYTISVDGVNVYTGSNATFSWNTTTVANGTRTLRTTVTDSSPTKQTATASRSVTVSNGTSSTAPFTASFSYPEQGATVARTASIGMATTAPWGQAKTWTLSANGKVLSTATNTGTTYWYYWDTTTAANGTYTLSLAVTHNGATATTTRTVTVANGTTSSSPSTSPSPTPTASFTASFSHPDAGATVARTASIGMATTAPWGETKTWTLSANGRVLSTATNTGTTYWYYWDTQTVPNGTYTLTLAVTHDGATATTTRTVTVANGTTSSTSSPSPTPTASFTASFSHPDAGATVARTASIGMATTAPWGQTKTWTLSANGRVIHTATNTGTTNWYYWDTTRTANGTYTLTLAVTHDGATATTTRTVTVRN